MHKTRVPPTLLLGHLLSDSTVVLLSRQVTGEWTGPLMLIILQCVAKIAQPALTVGDVCQGRIAPDLNARPANSDMECGLEDACHANTKTILH